MKLNTWNNVTDYLQFFGFAIIAVALSFSNFFMSFGMFWLAGVLVLQIAGDLYQKKSVLQRWKRFTSNSSAIALAALILLPIVGLLWTSNYNHAFWDIRMKLPLLVLPLLISGLNPLTQGQFRALTGIFILGVAVAVLFCLQSYWIGSPEIDKDVRDISIFISHVRFSLLIALAFGLLVSHAYSSAKGAILIILFAIPSFYFLYVIGSVTGVCALAVLIVWSSFHIAARQSAFYRKALVFSVPAVLIALSSMYLVKSYKEYFTLKYTSNQTDATLTSRGAAYNHYPDYPLIENGRLVYSFVADQELYEAWYERSTMHLDSLDERGHSLKGTLIRYLTSKDLRKDADGVAALTQEDVLAIEKGIPTCVEPTQHGLSQRLSRIFFEWSNYKAGGSPDGHSVIQRLEFWKTAWLIIQRNMWTGVGTGDIKSAFQDGYNERNSMLSNRYRLRAHNQYLTMWATYGVFGLIIFLCITFWPILTSSRSDLNLQMIVLLVAISFLTEDTLESQAGVMLMAYFYPMFTAKKSLSLFELRRPKQQDARLSSDVL
ncbi:MAG: hypothetical protein RL040_1170 [Bacteroidota bacterium]|jgi:hypothetical protein